MTTTRTAPITTRTRAEVYRLWVAALRSGEYTQGMEYLRRGHRFCCLGVLCDLAAKDGGEQWRKVEANIHTYRTQPDALGPTILKWMGLPAATQRKLMTANDEKCASFSKIADIIERDIMPAALARVSP